MTKKNVFNDLIKLTTAGPFPTRPFNIFKHEFLTEKKYKKHAHKNC